MQSGALRRGYSLNSKEGGQSAKLYKKGPELWANLGSRYAFKSCNKRSFYAGKSVELLSAAIALNVNC